MRYRITRLEDGKVVEGKSLVEISKAFGITSSEFYKKHIYKKENIECDCFRVTVKETNETVEGESLRDCANQLNINVARLYPSSKFYADFIITDCEGNPIETKHTGRNKGIGTQYNTKRKTINKWKLEQYNFSPNIISAQNFKVKFENTVDDYDWKLLEDLMKSIIKKYTITHSIFIEFPETKSFVKGRQHFCVTFSLYLKTEITDIKEKVKALSPMFNEIDKLIETFKITETHRNPSKID